MDTPTSKGLSIDTPNMGLWFQMVLQIHPLLQALESAVFGLKGFTFDSGRQSELGRQVSMYR